TSWFETEGSPLCRAPIIEVIRAYFIM
ncbi:hypothetical protein CFC21_007600, partial [Triticum aestivum]